MATKKPKTVLFRRKRQKKTNYRTRLRLLLSRKPRLVVRLTNTKVIAQIAFFTPKGDKIEVAVDSSSLKKKGWKFSTKNIPACYLTGILLGAACSKASVNEVILDSGSKSTKHGGRVFAVLKGALDAGLNIPFGKEDIFPSEQRLYGEHIQDYATSLETNKEKYEKQFAQYLKNNAKPTTMRKAVEEIKSNILT